MDYTVILTNQEKAINKQIVDNDGKILDFPDVEYTDVLNEELGKGTIKPIVKYETVFEKIDDSKFIMVWTVRPDGRWIRGASVPKIMNHFYYIHISILAVILQCHLNFTA